MSYVAFALPCHYQSLINGKFKLVISLDILLEYEEVIQRKYGVKTATALVTLLGELNNVIQTRQYFKWQLIENDADEK